MDISRSELPLGKLVLVPGVDRGGNPRKYLAEVSASPNFHGDGKIWAQYEKWSGEVVGGIFAIADCEVFGTQGDLFDVLDSGVADFLANNSSTFEPSDLKPSPTPRKIRSDGHGLPGYAHGSVNRVPLRRTLKSGKVWEGFQYQFEFWIEGSHYTRYLKKAIAPKVQQAIDKGDTVSEILATFNLKFPKSEKL